MRKGVLFNREFEKKNTFYVVQYYINLKNKNKKIILFQINTHRLRN